VQTLGFLPAALAGTPMRVYTNARNKKKGYRKKGGALKNQETEENP
jgi:hypothetical protein